MKKFRFRLEKVLEYRQSVAEERKREFARRTSELLEAEERLEQLRKELSTVGVNEGAIITAEELFQLEAYAQSLRDRISETRSEIEERRKDVEEARTAYLEARQEAEVLERLKERRKSEYQEYVDKEDEKFLDELTTLRSGRDK